MPIRAVRTRLIVLVVASALAVAAWTASAFAATNVVADCNAHGRLTTQYSDGALRTALSTMPADVKEYTDCYDVIQRALLAQISSPRSDTPRAAVTSSGGSFLPTPVIVVLVILGLTAATLGAVAIRRRQSGE